MAHETFFTETKLTIDGEKINARVSWDESERQWLIEVLANGMALVEYTDTAAKLYAASLSADDMVNEYIQRVFKERQAAQPAHVDQGGDFEGFLEAVNAEPTPAQESVWYTEPVTSADGEQVKARVTRYAGEGGQKHRHIIEVLVDNLPITSEIQVMRVLSGREAQTLAIYKATDYMQRLNAIRAAEMGDETETITPPLTDKATRKAQLTAQIERLRRELESYEYELSTLEGE